MKQKLLTPLSVALLAALFCAGPRPASAQAAADGSDGSMVPAVDPTVVARLDDMGKYLRSLKSFTVKADTWDEMVTEDLQKLQFGGSIEYRAQRPGGLYAHIKTDRKDRELFYDGKTITLYAPRMKYYASLPAPPDLSGMVAVAQEHEWDLPLADLFLWGTDIARRTPMSSAIYVGPAKMGDAVLDQYAVRQGDVDWQVWLSRGDAPLPRKLVMTANNDPARPAYTAVLHWDTQAKVAASDFTFSPPEGAEEIEVVTVAEVEVAE
ncbi:DUF2092 domain-containing protein [Pseudoxanthomonas dokdonensis]|uniref:Periplasmic protein n=1 Tax=Pseudoxanthomonas dokdonensis TaxID=344882 RepID=A0A0R0CH59_9GAMM|nr:DUF2092 domain-containing protein [Pseudoxanthomonas dokdonensis]KRG69119.1 hypothetical protein ABB29_11935 [Pseudoxanthomonas dokdonensis]